VLTLDHGVTQPAKEGLGSLGQQQQLRDASSVRMPLERANQSAPEPLPPLTRRHDQRAQQTNGAVAFQTDGTERLTCIAAHNPKRQVSRWIDVLDGKSCFSQQQTNRGPIGGRGEPNVNFNGFHGQWRSRS